MRNRKTPHPLPYPCYTIPVLILVTLGLADTAYLALSHYRNYTDISYSSFCAISKAVNCDTVSQSPWSILLDIPVAIWGFFGYLLFGILALAARKNTPEKIPLWSLLFILGLLYSGTAVYFGYISATRIHSYCILCLLSYGISFTLLLYAWIIRRRFDKDSLQKSLAKALSTLPGNPLLKIGLPLLVIAFIGVKTALPHYWTYTFPPLSETIHTGMTEDFHPWIGAENPRLTIEEYSDYQCFQCYKMHFMLRRLIAGYPDRIRLIHRQYPMDHKENEIVVPTRFHVGAGKMARIAIYAATQGKFWQANDLLFELGRDKETFNTRMIAEKTGLSAGVLSMATRDKNIGLLLRRDILEGMKLGITGTPSFVINGQLYKGSIPAEILKEALR